MCSHLGKLGSETPLVLVPYDVELWNLAARAHLLGDQVGAHWGNKADIGLCMWRPLVGPTLLHIDKVKDHETMGRPTLCEMIHDSEFNRFRVGRIGYDILGDQAE